MCSRSLLCIAFSALALAGERRPVSLPNQIKQDPPPIVSLSASQSLIAYGEHVTIRWKSKRVEHLDAKKTNFRVDKKLLAGSLRDRPASSTTYTVVGYDKDGREATASITVKVKPSTRKFWVVGDMAIAGNPQLLGLWQPLTSVRIEERLAWPEQASPDDVVILLESAAIGPDQESEIRHHLAAGGRIVFTGFALSKLSTGNPKNNKLEKIGAWCFGATEQLGGRYIEPMAKIVSSNPGAPISSTTYGREVLNIGGVAPIATGALLFTELGNKGSAYATYRPHIGGRIGIVGMVSAGLTPKEQLRQTLAAAVIREVADAP